MLKKKLPIPLIFSIIFICLACIGLTKVGLYYDELHQAVASFAYKGMQPVFFNRFEYHGIPLMNMTYSGAIKSNIYGMYMFLFDQEFSVLSWRLMGVLSVGLSLFLFGVLIGKNLPKYTLTLFYLLFLTDVSILFMVRYDWGPVALALSMRLLFIAFWIKGDSEDRPAKMNSLILGLIAGVSFYEKLSSVVLIIPLIYILLFNKHRRNAKHFIYASSGYMIGCMPLIAINIYTCISQKVLFSMESVKSMSQFSIPDFINYFSQYISLGNGSQVKSWISGVTTPAIMINFETILMISLLIFLLLMALLDGFKGKFISYNWISFLSYITLGIVIYLLPQKTWTHHWIIGTPFQYIGISFAVFSLLSENKKFSPTIVYMRRKIILALIFLFLAIRSYSLFSAEKIFLAGNTSSIWSTEFTRLGEFAAKQPGNALFIAADWGVATQIYCLGNGKTKIFELFWRSEDATESTLNEIINKNNINYIYLLYKEPPTSVFPVITSNILPTMKNLHECKEVDIEDEIKFKNIRIHKFVKD